MGGSSVELTGRTPPLGGCMSRAEGVVSETSNLLQDMEPRFTWGVAFGSWSADPIHHIIEGDRMLCSGGKAHPTHHGTPSAPRPCARCLREWRKQAS